MYYDMETKKKIFLIGYIINWVAVFLTTILLSVGGVEGNPIIANIVDVEGNLFISMIMVILFIQAVWVLLFLILIYIPDRVKDNAINIGSYYASIALCIMVAIDCGNDYLWLVYYISTLFP